MNALSIDVEDWYHSLDPDPTRWDRYEDRVVPATRRLLELFARHSARATFFVLGHVADRHPGLVREIDAAGHEVACHGSEHRFIYHQTPEAFAADVRRCRDTLEALTGKPVRGYRAPYFSITRPSLWALAELAGLGFTYDSSIFPTHNHRYGIPDAPRLPHRRPEGLLEVPVSTFPVGGQNVPCGGGAYFRLLPLELLLRLYQRRSALGEPIVFYLHPWEVDPGHPRMPLPAGLRWRHYFGLERTFDRLSRLLTVLRFGPMGELAAWAAQSDENLNETPPLTMDGPQP